MNDYGLNRLQFILFCAITNLLFKKVFFFALFTLVYILSGRHVFNIRPVCLIPYGRLFRGNWVTMNYDFSPRNNPILPDLCIQPSTLTENKIIETNVQHDCQLFYYYYFFFNVVVVVVELFISNILKPRLLYI